MASVNKVILIGRLGRDPELRNTQTGGAVCNMALATDESYVDKNTGNKIDQVEWHRVTAFNRTAENCAQFLHKGSLLFVEGKLATRKFQGKDGVERQVTEIKAERVQFLDSKGNGNIGNGGNARPQNQQRKYNHQAPAQNSFDSVPF